MKKTIKQAIARIYKEREIAHKIILECDKAIDKILKEVVKTIK
jgi:hypothetical protein